MLRVLLLSLALVSSVDSLAVIPDGSSGVTACQWGYDINASANMWCDSWEAGHYANGFSSTWIEGRNITLSCGDSGDIRSCTVNNYGGGYFITKQCVGGLLLQRVGNGWACAVDPCEANPNSPECQPCYPLQSDQWSADLASIYGYDDEEFCTPEYLSDEQECQNVLGYANDAQVCIDDQLECTATGGSYGTIGYGDGTPEAVCIPSDYADDLPTCDIGTVNVVIPELDGFGFACSSPLDPPLPDDPTENDVIDQDTDGDGIPDRSDPDIDGDGVPNSQDPDIDGDGVSNEDETDADDNGTVSGGLTCAARPSCSGDPVSCSVVLQTWATRCEAKEIGQGITRLEAAVRDMQSALAEGLSADGFDPDGQSITDGEPESETFDFSTDIANIYSQGGAAGSCPADTVVATSFGSVPISWSMLCEFASTIRPLVIFLFGLAAFRMTMRAF